jgi:hypothetical protein
MTLSHLTLDALHELRYRLIAQRSALADADLPPDESLAQDLRLVTAHINELAPVNRRLATAQARHFLQAWVASHQPDVS